MRAVNLLPKDAQKSQSFRGRSGIVVAAIAAAAVVVVALGAGYMSAHTRSASEQGKLAAARAELARANAEARAEAPSAKPAAAPIVLPPAVTSETEPRLAALSSALSGRVAWDRVLRELSQVLPSDVTVSSLTMTQPAPAAAGATTAPASASSGFSLAGAAFSHDGVARLLSRLMLVPDLEGVTLQSSTADAATGQVSFQIDAGIKVPSAPGAGA